MTIGIGGSNTTFFNGSPGTGGLSNMLTSLSTTNHFSGGGSYTLNPSFFNAIGGSLTGGTQVVTWAPLSDIDYVSNCYQTFLGRSHDIDGLTFWAIQLQNGMSRADVASAFYNCAEAQSRMGLSVPLVG